MSEPASGGGGGGGGRRGGGVQAFWTVEVDPKKAIEPSYVLTSGDPERPEKENPVEPGWHVEQAGQLAAGREHVLRRMQRERVQLEVAAGERRVDAMERLVDDREALG